MVLSWTASTGASSYTLYRGASSEGESSTAYQTGLMGSSYTDTGVTNGTAYFYTLTAVNAGGASLPSNEASATPLPPVPAIPTGLSAVANSSSQITLSWTASNGASSYILQHSPDGSTSWTGIASPTATTYQDSGLTAASSYYYRVAATNIGGTSGYSGVASATTFPIAPAAPTGLTANAADGTVALAWTASAMATSYNLYRGSTGTGSESSTPYKTGLTGTTYTDTVVANGQTYFYKLTAVNAGGESSQSNEASAVPLPLLTSLSVSPTSVTGGTSSTGTVTLSSVAHRGPQCCTLQQHDGSQRPRHRARTFGADQRVRNAYHDLCDSAHYRRSHRYAWKLQTRVPP